MQKQISYRLNIDQDTILTPKEKIKHQEAMENLRNGNVYDWEEVKKEIGEYCTNSLE